MVKNLENDLVRGQFQVEVSNEICIFRLTRGEGVIEDRLLTVACRQIATRFQIGLLK
jgi:hypothetical protein